MLCGAGAGAAPSICTISCHCQICLPQGSECPRVALGKQATATPSTLHAHNPPVCMPAGLGPSPPPLECVVCFHTGLGGFVGQFVFASVAGQFFLGGFCCPSCILVLLLRAPGGCQVSPPLAQFCLSVLLGSNSRAALAALLFRDQARASGRVAGLVQCMQCCQGCGVTGRAFLKRLHSSADCCKSSQAPAVWWIGVSEQSGSGALRQKVGLSRLHL